MARHPSRRDALKGLGAAAGVAAISGCEPGSKDAATDTDTGVDPALGAIDTIVVLMMENRSFDHYFGALTLEEGRDDVDGLTADMFNPDRDGVPVAPFRMTKGCQSDPPHGWGSSHDQFNNGANDGFVRQHHDGRSETAREAIGYYNRDDLPIYYALADDNALCDRWFCSVMSSTWPNRFYSYTATSDGGTNNSFSQFPFAPRAIFDQLDEAGVAWKVYFHEAPFAALLERTGGALGDKIRPISEFYQDAAADRLPPVVFVEPGYTMNDDHPPRAVILGQVLAGSVYRALAESPVWDRCMFVIDYDEHGGFFDHVPPPTVKDDHADEGFDQLGFRVPAMVLGPYARREVVHTQYEQVSVLKHIQEVHGLEPLTRRNRHATALWDCLDLEAMANREPRPPTPIPVLELSRADLGEDCFVSLVPAQPELDQAIELGQIDPRYDRRHLAYDMFNRMLVRAEKLGVIRFG